MEIVLFIITVHGLLGTFDTLWNHEYTAKLPKTESAKVELLIHSYRAFLYSLTFIAIGVLELHGIYAWGLLLILIAEVFLTFWDFIEEDKSRKLSGTERITHTIMGMTGGAFIAYIVPVLLEWSTKPSAILFTDRGVFTPTLIFFGCGALAWTIKDYSSYSAMANKKILPAQNKEISDT